MPRLLPVTLHLPSVDPWPTINANKGRTSSGSTRTAHGFGEPRTNCSRTIHLVLLFRLPTWPRAFSSTSPRTYALSRREQLYDSRFRKVEKGATADVSSCALSKMEAPVFPAIMLAFTRAPLSRGQGKTEHGRVRQAHVFLILCPPNLATPSSNSAYQGSR